MSWDRERQDLAALRLLPEWLVVVKVIVIHLDFTQAARTCLFGLMGDQFVQVVDATLPLASQLWELAEACESRASTVTAAQDFTRMSANDMNAMVECVTLKTYYDHQAGQGELKLHCRPSGLHMLQRAHHPVESFHAATGSISQASFRSDGDAVLAFSGCRAKKSSPKF
ncbi:hypothetical protein E4T52_04797 [Aureobasidium sp. EXF-3400]|nr:hypothetical protein E4T51_03936 [Aureobasidium sp. EXF-12344]KAI4780286.1 hypothetical protein E4T52_04797 [Aureobasidium sp. EXF-3400]